MTTNRRHDVDALRVIALALLIFYHILICYQPFAPIIFFIQSNELLKEAWFLGELMNIWRIPILFLISGMGVRFAMERRNTKEILTDRSVRLLIPLCFGTFFIFPLFPALFSLYNSDKPFYFPFPGHLWFLQYLMLYFLCLLPLFSYLKKYPDCRLLNISRNVFSKHPFLLLLTLPLMLEAWIIKPNNIASFVLIDYHRFWYGFICFFIGFLCVSIGEAFWRAVSKVCRITLPIAFALFLYRISLSESERNSILVAFESMCWMLSLIGIGACFLNRPSKIFAYLNKAVFPVYIIHMPVQQLIAYFLFPITLPPLITLFLHVTFTFAIALTLYEYLIRRIAITHPFMGLGLPKRNRPYKWYPRLAVYILLPLMLLAYAGTWIGKSLINANASQSVDYSHLSNYPELDRALIKASQENKSKEVIKALEQGANINGKNNSGDTALGVAAFHGNHDIVQILIDRGADVNQGDNNSYRPLHSTMFLGDLKGTQILLDNGASTDVRGLYGETPIESMDTPYGIVIAITESAGIEVFKKAVFSGRKNIKDLLKDRIDSTQQTTDTHL